MQPDTFHRDGTMHSNRIIDARSVGRNYRRVLKSEGFRSGLKNLFRPETETVPALSGFDLTLDRGEFLGLIGPNGAGKTTLIKLLSGLIEPSSGTLSVLDHTPARRKEAFLQRIALVMGQKSQLWWDLPAMDSFRLNQAIYGISDSRFKIALDRLGTCLEAQDLYRSPVRTLSLGERMRVELIGALLHEPELLFLDEPTIGLDAPAQKRIRDFLRREHKDRGLSLILTSHYMEDIRSLCPRCVLIQNGVKRFDGSTDAMLAQVRERKLLKVRYADPAGIADPADPSIAADRVGAAVKVDSAPDASDTALDASDMARDFSDLPAVVMEQDAQGFVLAVKPEELKSCIRIILDRWDIRDILVEEEPLEDSILKLYALEDAHDR